MKKNISILFLSFAFIVMSLYFVMMSTLNPISHTMPDIDSSIFIYMGMGMRAGAVPYIDMFDHKGPLLWFIQWFGLELGNGSTLGIWFLEWVAMFINIAFLYKCARLFTPYSLLAILASGISMLSLSSFFQGGNFSEEWALPFIIISLYIFLLYFVKGKVNFLTIFITAMCFASVLLIRVNMIGVWSVFLIAILLDLLYKKEYKKILHCAMLYLLGISIVFLPFCFYYKSHNALQAMWDMYINFNVEYSTNGATFSNFVNMMKNFLCSDVIIWLSMSLYAIILISRRKKSWEICIILFFIASLGFCAIGGRNLPHYGIVLIPCTIVPVAVILNVTYKLVIEKKNKFILVGTIIASVLAMYGIETRVSNQLELIKNTRNENDSEQEVVEYIEGHSNIDDSILIMGSNCRFYVETNRLANTKYFIQHYMFDYDGEIYESTQNYIEEDPPKLVIMLMRNIDGDTWGNWMIEFHSTMKERVENGDYTYYTNGFFVAFERS